MAKAKTNSQSFHTSRTRAKSSRLSSRKQFDRQVFNATKRSVLTIIIFSMLIVILAVLFVYFNDPERLVKRKISDIATDYYESYYYPSLIGNAKDDQTLTEIMSPYATPGFATISLRQLLLYDNEHYANTAAFLKQYCDENKTFVHIYPEAPFGKKNYRIDYIYSCAF